MHFSNLTTRWRRSQLWSNKVGFHPLFLLSIILLSLPRDVSACRAPVPSVVWGLRALKCPVLTRFVSNHTKRLNFGGTTAALIRCHLDSGGGCVDLSFPRCSSETASLPVTHRYHNEWTRRYEGNNNTIRCTVVFGKLGPFCVVKCHCNADDKALKASTFV